MRLGPITIHRHRKNPAGLEIYPWQALTTDRLTPEVKQIVSKMARSAARDHFDETRERLIADLTRYFKENPPRVEDSAPQ